MTEKQKEVEKKEVIKEEKHRCVKCKSLFGYLKIKDKAWQCRSCGFLDKEVIA